MGAGGLPLLHDFAVARYNRDGSRDLTFGVGGVTLTDFFLLDDGASAVAIQPNGRIVVAGTAIATLESTETEEPRAALVRYNRNGTLDTSFGLAGKVVTDLGGNGAQSADDVAIQPDGKIVIAGSVYYAGGPNFAAARYNPDGSLDPTFGSSGISHGTWCGDSQANAVAIEADGMIVIAGRDYVCQGFSLARYTSGGVLDVGFGSGGKVAAPTASYAGAQDVRILSNGKIIAGGYLGRQYSVGPPSADFAVARYNSSGTLDDTFGISGIATAHLDYFALAAGIAVQRDGKIVAAGFTGSDELTGLRFAVARFALDGTLDSGFGSAGTVTTDWAANGGNSGAAAVALQADGKIVAAGYSMTTIPLLTTFAVVRYRAT